MNRYREHLFILPEDGANRQIADGFALHPQVQDQRLQVVAEAGGWAVAMDQVSGEWAKYLREQPLGHLVVLIDFDDKFASRFATCVAKIPADLKDRVFVIGAAQTPEKLKAILSKSYETIGTSLAEDCYLGQSGNWSHAHLNHNAGELARLTNKVKSFLF